MRDGYVVTWRGHEYEATPDGDGVRIYATEPGDGFTEVRPGRYVRVVPFGEYDNMAYVRTTCTWRGQPFIVLAEADSWLRVEYTGGRAPIARQLGLEEFDFGVYQGWAPAHEVADLYQHGV
ncbi:hypothetical protein [Mangrovihabitans endophyticus]|uniref:Uncharacterized protein n=1 Tax=Mangrovihabitans endophyticus TaxID=1751298 RepID=A0A8J3FP54_9ACTN|nr:hypothetical protein [Mangrovihabitans endophyticus]GGK96787.1 hypothetical protein GCM10012284_33840 [Mangrovihabitans endophyticus]